jgi:hypothetical protein
VLGKSGIGEGAKDGGGKHSESVGATGGCSVVQLEGRAAAEAGLGGSVVGPARALGAERPVEMHSGERTRTQRLQRRHHFSNSALPRALCPNAFACCVRRAAAAFVKSFERNSFAASECVTLGLPRRKY